MVKRAYLEVVARQNYSLIDSFFATNIFDHSAFEGQQQALLVLKKPYLNF
jgi:hypothetical protein